MSKLVNDSNKDSSERQICFAVISVLLIVTAFLKCWSVVTVPFFGLIVGVPTSLLWFTIFLEFAVVYWNFTSTEVPWLLVVNGSLFAVFSIVSAYKIAVGDSSCGCAGLIGVSPYFSFLVSLIVVVVIVFFACKHLGGAFGLKTFLRLPLRLYGDISHQRRGQLLGIGALVGILVCSESSVFAALRDFTFGKNPVNALSSPAKDLVLGVEETRSIEIKNNSDRRVRIVGVEKSCKCVVENAIGLTVPARSSLAIPIAVTPGKLGYFQEEIHFYLDHPLQFRLEVCVVGFVSKGEF